MIHYGKLDVYGERIRDRDEINNIKNDFNTFLVIGNKAIMKKYESNWDHLSDLIQNKTMSVTTLAIAYWDYVHPLSKQDNKKRSKIMRKKLVDAKIFS